MEKPTTHQIEMTPNEKLQLLQERITRIEAGDLSAARGLSPHNVAVEGMYNVRQALKKAKSGDTDPNLRLHV